MKELCCEKLSFQYEGRTEASLNKVNLTIRPGEFVVITGESGCGKTTLTRCINGQIPHFYKGTQSGTVCVGGKSIPDTPSYEIARWIGSVFQDPRSQFFTTNTTDEVAFGCENLALPPETIQKSVCEAFDDLKIDDLRNRSIFELSSGERQKIAIASAYAMKPELFVLDEPSANLDMQATELLAQLLARLKRKGHTIIVSEHRLYYLMALADRILYMKNGAITEEWTPGQARRLTAAEMEHRGLRSFHIGQFPARNPDHQRLHSPTCSLQASHLTAKIGGKPVLRDISLSAGLDQDRMIGITGENGVGKTTLVRLLCGLIKEKTGQVQINGRILSHKARVKETYFVMQDADYQLFTESVADELSFGNDKDADTEAKMEAVLALLNLEACKEYHPLSLSGGQKQRVTIAAAAVSDAKVLFFDEPTSGLDGKNMRNVAAILKQLSQKGKLIFVISHDIEFLLCSCDHIIRLESGRIAEDFTLDADGSEHLNSILTPNL